MDGILSHTQYVTPYTICFNLENDGFISQQTTIGAKVADIETNHRKKDYQKREIFEGFEQHKEFLIKHTNLAKIPKVKNPEPKIGIVKKCWNKFLSLLPIKTDDIHFSPITGLCSSNEHNYTLPELILLFLEFTDNYFEKKDSLNQGYVKERPIQEQESEICSKHTNSMSEVNITEAGQNTKELLRDSLHNLN